MDSNKSSFNLNKTKALLFGNYKTKPEKMFEIDGIQIENVSEIKFKGVTIDKKLLWKIRSDTLKPKSPKVLQ